MTDRLQGKVALVTGAAGGIGGAIADLFAEEGAIVIASDLAGTSHACDVSDREQVDSLVAEVLRCHGRLDVLAHAAALTGGTGAFLELDPADWHRYLAINLDGTFHVCQAAARVMADRGGGAIVAIGSVNSFAAEPVAASYVASKHGVLGLVRAMSVDLAPHGIRVNMVAPGAITVPRNAELFASAPLHAMFARAIPAGHTGLPEHVAHAALHLVSDAAAYTTGTALVVDGGTLAMLMDRLE